MRLSETEWNFFLDCHIDHVFIKRVYHRRNGAVARQTQCLKRDLHDGYICVLTHTRSHQKRLLLLCCFSFHPSLLRGSRSVTRTVSVVTRSSVSFLTYHILLRSFFSRSSALIELSTWSVGGEQNRRVCWTDGSRGRMQQRLGWEGLTLKQGGARGGGGAEGEWGQRCHGGSDGELTL